MAVPSVKILAATAAIGLWPWPAWAAEADAFGLLDSSLRMIWGLLVVLGILLLLYGLLKKRFSLLASSGQQQIRVIELKPLMGKKALCLVEVRGREYLLGISSDRIDPIACLSETPGPSFADTLQRSGAGAAP